MSSVFLALLGFAITSYVLILRKLLKKNNPNTNGLPYPPGPNPKPLVGNMHDIPKADPWVTYTAWRRSYGDIVHLEAFGQHIVVLNSFKIANDLFNKRSKIYSSRPTIPALDLFGWSFLLSNKPYDSTWKTHRRLSHQVFRSQAALAYRPTQLVKIHQYLRNLLTNPHDFEALTRSLSASIIMKEVYGYETRQKNDHFVKIAEEAIAMVTAALLPGKTLLNLLPILCRVPDWMPGASTQRVATSCRKLVYEMQTAPLNFAKKAATSKSPCIVSDLLEQIPRGESTSKLEEAVRSIAATAYAAGNDTTVSTSLSLILSMVLYPDAAKKAQAEIDRVVGTTRLPTYADRAALPYVEAYYREVMRWHPVAPLGVPHATSDHDVYDGYFIPKGTMVLGNIWAMTRDEAYYGADTDKFIPERFFTSDGKLNHNDTILGFGFGRRVCVGRYMADATVWATLVSLLATFDVKKAKNTRGEEIEVLEKYTDGLTVQPLSFQCSITPRSEEARRLVLATASV